MVDANTQATYFGDLTIFPMMEKGKVVDNAQATFEHLRSINSAMQATTVYSRNLINPVMKYKGAFTGDKVRIRLIKL